MEYTHLIKIQFSVTFQLCFSKMVWINSSIICKPMCEIMWNSLFLVSFSEVGFIKCENIASATACLLKQNIIWVPFQSFLQLQAQRNHSFPWSTAMGKMNRVFFFSKKTLHQKEHMGFPDQGRSGPRFSGSYHRRASRSVHMKLPVWDKTQHTSTVLHLT